MLRMENLYNRINNNVGRMDFLKDILGINQSAATIDVALLVLRVAIGMLMLNHGIPKNQKVNLSRADTFF